MPSNELKHQSLQEQQQSLCWDVCVWASKAQISRHQQLEPPTNPTQGDELHVEPLRTPSNWSGHTRSSSWTLITYKVLSSVLTMFWAASGQDLIQIYYNPLHCSDLGPLFFWTLVMFCLKLHFSWCICDLSDWWPFCIYHDVGSAPEHSAVLFESAESKWNLLLFKCSPVTLSRFNYGISTNPAQNSTKEPFRVTQNSR